MGLMYEVKFRIEDGWLSNVAKLLEGIPLDIKLVEQEAERPTRTVNRSAPLRDIVVGHIKTLKEGAVITALEIGTMIEAEGFAATSASPYLSACAKAGALTHISANTYRRTSKERFRIDQKRA